MEYKNVINFYQMANKLKYGIRTGWKEVGITNERLESFAEHIYGCIILAIGLNSEAKLDLDMFKVIKMIIAKELEKIDLGQEVTPVTKSFNKEGTLKNCAIIEEITSGMLIKEEFISLIEEFATQQSKEAKFCSQILKIESDLQAKDYELRVEFSLENAKADVQNFGEPLASEILPQVQKPSDGWILYDRQYYTDELFVNLSNEIQKL